jgi:hypothetical protein
MSATHGLASPTWHLLPIYKFDVLPRMWAAGIAPDGR